MQTPLTPALIFDLDGTLADTLADLQDAASAVAETAGRESLDQELAAFTRHYSAHIADKTRVYAGVEETLGVLASDGMRLGVLTAKPHDLAVQLLKALGMHRFFTAVCGAGLSAYEKPDANLFRHMLDLLGGVGPGAVLIGDSESDVALARNAGVPVILVTYGYGVGLGRLLPDATTSDFRAIPDLARFLLHSRQFRLRSAP